MNDDTLDCQDCGAPVMVLTPEQKRWVADRPYNFIVYCQYCKRDYARHDY